MASARGWNVVSDEHGKMSDDELCMVDLRKVGSTSPLLPELEQALQKKTSFTMARPLVVQIQKITDVTKPSSKQHHQHDGSARMLHFVFTDGFLRGEGIEWGKDALKDVNVRSKLGLKIRLEKVEGDGGFVFFNASNCCVLGGSVAGLGQGAAVKDEVESMREKSVDTLGGAPPFVPLQITKENKSVEQNQHQRPNHNNNNRSKGGGNKGSNNNNNNNNNKNRKQPKDPNRPKKDPNRVKKKDHNDKKETTTSSAGGGGGGDVKVTPVVSTQEPHKGPVVVKKKEQQPPRPRPQGKPRNQGGPKKGESNDKKPKPNRPPKATSANSSKVEEKK